MGSGEGDSGPGSEPDGENSFTVDITGVELTDDEVETIRSDIVRTVTERLRSSRPEPHRPGEPPAYVRVNYPRYF